MGLLSLTSYSSKTWVFSCGIYVACCAWSHRNVSGVMCNMWLFTLYIHVDIIFCWWATLGAGLGITFYSNKFTSIKIQYDIVGMWL
jgi:hypothetical protein